MPADGQQSQRTTAAIKLLVLWLFVAFCGTIYLGFHRPHKEGVADVIRIAERLAVVGRYAKDLPDDLRSQLLDSAAEIEADPLARKVIEGEAPSAEQGQR